MGSAEVLFLIPVVLAVLFCVAVILMLVYIIRKLHK